MSTSGARVICCAPSGTTHATNATRAIHATTATGAARATRAWCQAEKRTYMRRPFPLLLAAPTGAAPSLAGCHLVYHSDAPIHTAF